jgi:hypothetical protein
MVQRRLQRRGWAKQLNGVGTATAVCLLRRGGDRGLSTPQNRTRSADPALQSGGLATLADRSSLWLGSAGGQPRRCSRYSLRARMFQSRSRGRGSSKRRGRGHGRRESFGIVSSQCCSPHGSAVRRPSRCVRPRLAPVRPKAPGPGPVFPYNGSLISFYSPRNREAG